MIRPAGARQGLPLMARGPQAPIIKGKVQPAPAQGIVTERQSPGGPTGQMRLILLSQIFLSKAGTKIAEYSKSWELSADTDTKPPGTVFECLFSTLQNIAHDLADGFFVQAAGVVCDRRES